MSARRAATRRDPVDQRREVRLERAAPSGPERLSVCVCYPAGYSIGMSNLGFHAAVRLFSEEAGVRCERAFFDPAGGVPGRSFETGIPLGQFDVLAFSVSFEEDYFALVGVLTAAGVTLRAEDRGGDEPLVVLGGFCASLNTEPVASFVDAVVVGAAEAIVPSLVDALAGSRGAARRDRLEQLSQQPGVYVPSLYSVERDGGRIRGFTARADAPLPVVAAKRRPRLASSLILTPDAFFADTFLVEATRGCPHACRFCAAGHVGKPASAFPVEEIIGAVRAALSETRKVGLVTATLGDHPRVRELLAAIVDLDVELTVSSLRADRLDAETCALLARAGVRTATIAPETGSDELREALGKSMRREEILGAAARLAEAGIASLKLYFMIGLPGEREDDVAEIVDLVRDVQGVFRAGHRRGRVSVSASAFVPKPRTPFQWAPVADAATLRRRLGRLRRALAARPRVEFTGVGPREARRQAVLARGPRELSAAVTASVLEGLPWSAAVRRSGVDANAVVGVWRDPCETFPWEIVQTGPSRSELRSSLGTAVRLLTADGRDPGPGATDRSP